MLPDCKRCSWRTCARPKRYMQRVIGAAAILTGVLLLCICAPEGLWLLLLSVGLICLGVRLLACRCWRA